MEYSQLIGAVKQHKQKEVNALINDIRPRLLGFLHIHMNAGKQDAEDCAQQALLDSLQAINENKIRDADRILSFLITSCRNNYLNMIKQDNKEDFDDYSAEYSQKPRQLLAILDNERRQMLEKCIELLSDGYRTFINYWFTHPGSDAKAASIKFNISIANAWTRKHRIIKKLQKCYQEKSEEKV